MTITDILSDAAEDWLPTAADGTSYLDFTDAWNSFVSQMREDNDYYERVSVANDWQETAWESISKGTPGLGLNPFVLLTGIQEIKIPLTFTIPIVDLDVSVIDLILVIWLTKKLPILHPAILGFSLPLPLGLLAFAIKDLPFPLGSLFDLILPGPRYSGAESGFKVVDVYLDWFLFDMLKLLVSMFGYHAFEAVKMLVMWYMNFRKPKVRDIVNRIKPEDAPAKFDSELETSLRDLVVAFEASVTTFNEKVQALIGWLADPYSYSKPNLDLLLD
jgi:hypothetical protein